jgi:hypothetical protein
VEVGQCIKALASPIVRGRMKLDAIVPVELVMAPSSIAMQSRDVCKNGNKRACFNTRFKFVFTSFAPNHLLQ